MTASAIFADFARWAPRTFPVPDSTGLAPLVLPQELLRMHGGIPPSPQPSPDAVRLFEKSMMTQAPGDVRRETLGATLAACLTSLPIDSRPMSHAAAPQADGASHVSRLASPATASVPIPSKRVIPVSPSEAEHMAPARFFTASDGTVLPYREYVPKAAMAAGPGGVPGRARFPIVLYMHGAGCRGSDGMALCDNLGFKCLLSKVATATPAIILAPQCPEDAQWVDTPWGERVHAFNPAPSRHLAAALELFDRELESLPVDRSRILLCGGSMGGYAAWDILSRRPGFFAAALPVCGGGTPDKIAEASRTTPVWTVHGDADTTVPVENTRKIAEAIRADPGHAAEFRYREMPGVGHDCWTPTYTDPEVLDWFFAQRRADVACALAVPAPLDPRHLQPVASANAPARDAAIAASVNTLTSAIAAAIDSTPSLAGGEKKVTIRLKHSVLGGSEITLSAKDGRLLVEIAPATPEAEQIIAKGIPQLERALAEHVPTFNAFTVTLKGTAAKGNEDEAN